MIARAIGIVVAAAAFCAALIPSAGADPAASRVVDRTFSCDVRLWAGARRVDTSANRGFRDPDRPSHWKWLPYASVGGRDLSSYAWIFAGSPPPQPEQEPARAWVWVGVDAVRCNVTRKRLPLSSRGLIGGAASQFQGSDEYDCPAASRILVRVSGTFVGPVALLRRRFNDRPRYATPAGAPVKTAALMVATAAGRPLVYATVSETGKAQLFTAKGCIPK